MKMMMSLFLADAVLLASHYSLTFFTKLVQCDFFSYALFLAASFFTIFFI